FLAGPPRGASNRAFWRDCRKASLVRLACHATASETRSYSGNGKAHVLAAQSREKKPSKRSGNHEENIARNHRSNRINLRVCNSDARPKRSSVHCRPRDRRGEHLP